MQVMTTRQVARLVGEGFPEHRLHYAIRTGALPAPSMLGHSMVWTEQQANAAVRYFREGPGRHKTRNRDLPHVCEVSD
jgi:hypothetical protein